MTLGAGGLQQAKRRRGKVVGKRCSSVDCPNDCKSAGHEKVQCLENYHRLRTEQTCFLESSQVTSHGLLSTIRKPSANAVSISLTHKLGPKKATQSNSKVKIMLITLFDLRGVILSEFLPPGQTINQ